MLHLSVVGTQVSDFKSRAGMRLWQALKNTDQVLGPYFLYDLPKKKISSEPFKTVYVVQK